MMMFRKESAVLINMVTTYFISLKYAVKRIVTLKGLVLVFWNCSFTNIVFWNFPYWWYTGCFCV